MIPKNERELWIEHAQCKFAELFQVFGTVLYEDVSDEYRKRILDALDALSKGEYVEGLLPTG